MAPRSSSQNWRYTLLVVLLALGIAFAKWKGWLPEEGTTGTRPQAPPVITTTPPKPPRTSSSSYPPGPGGETTEAGRRKISGAWEELSGCRLKEDRGNDGDSFEVTHHGQTYILRLYFADCPEKYRHQYNGPRLAEQGRYFGGLTEEETVEAGEKARDYALNLLREAPFTVLTRWEKVYDSERFYAFVTTPAGDLAELLVGQGLARIHTKGEDRPGLNGARVPAAKNRLQELEREARSRRLGAWGRGGGR